MLNLLNVNHPIKVNGQVYNSSHDAYKVLKDYKGEIVVELTYERPVTAQPKETPVVKEEPLVAVPQANDEKLYRIQVKKWMTQPSTPDFDFMEKWNNNTPMPLVIMKGTILEETRGMFKMELYAEAEPSSACMACGRKLTHPVSMMYGIGPECGEHHYISKYKDEEIEQYLAEVREQMANIKWTGWVIKSAIKEMEEL